MIRASARLLDRMGIHYHDGGRGLPAASVFFPEVWAGHGNHALTAMPTDQAGLGSRGLLQTAGFVLSDRPPTPHSFGLEGLVQEGIVRDRPTLRQHFYLEHVLPSPRSNRSADRGLRAWRGGAGLGRRPAATIGLGFGELCILGSAVRGAREPRDASEAIGRQRNRTGGRDFAEAWRPNATVRAAGPKSWPMPACVAAAIEGRTLGSAARCGWLAAIVLPRQAAGLIAAAMKASAAGPQKRQPNRFSRKDASQQAPEQLSTEAPLAPAAEGSMGSPRLYVVGQQLPHLRDQSGADPADRGADPRGELKDAFSGLEARPTEHFRLRG